MAWDCTRPLHRRKSPLFFLATVVAVVCCCWYGVNFNTHVIPTPSPWQPKIDLQTSNGSQSRGDRTTKYDMNHRLSSHTNYTAYTYLKTVKNKETNVGVEEKSLFEKVSYQLLKSVMQSLLTSHLRRKEKMKLMNSYPRGREGRGDLLTRDINYLSDQSAGRVSDESESAPTTSLKSTNNATKQSSTSTRPKKILFYGGFYGSKKQWKRMLRNMNLRDCPERKCVFTTKDSEASTADAVVFHYIEFALSDLPKVRLPHQRYVWLNTESSERLTQANQGRLRHSHWSDAGVFNWTMTYHRSSDIYMPYGSLFSLRDNILPVRLHFNTSSITYTEYMKALRADIQQQQQQQPKQNPQPQQQQRQQQPDISYIQSEEGRGERKGEEGGERRKRRGIKSERGGGGGERRERGGGGGVNRRGRGGGERNKGGKGGGVNRRGRGGGGNRRGRGGGERENKDWLSPLFLRRPKLVSWMVSHCNTLSGRELYVRELQKYVEVDVYGKCGNLTCGHSHRDTNCYQDVLLPTYKFYLAFENNMCDDYITEKVWNTMHFGLVPVVFGGARYEDYLPPHSYIDATPLTPSQLAKLLIRVGESSREYARYHLWRKYWRVLMYPPLCEMCYRLHHPQYEPTLAHPYTHVRKKPYLDDDTTASTNNNNNKSNNNNNKGNHISSTTTTTTTTNHVPFLPTSSPFTPTSSTLFTPFLPTSSPFTPLLDVWWLEVNNCTTLYPLAQYPRIDTNVLQRRLVQEAKLLEGKVKLFLKGPLDNG